MDTRGIPRGRNFWGEKWWFVLHSAAAAYTPDKALEFKSLLDAYKGLLPCKECRQHLDLNLKKYPVDNYLRDNNSLFLWTYILHDAVNVSQNKTLSASKKKISPNFEDVKKWYFAGLGDDCKSCTL